MQDLGPGACRDFWLLAAIGKIKKIQKEM